MLGLRDIVNAAIRTVGGTPVKDRDPQALLEQFEGTGRTRPGFVDRNSAVADALDLTDQRG